jgi:hypothetical protein
VEACPPAAAHEADSDRLPAQPGGGGGDDDDGGGGGDGGGEVGGGGGGESRGGKVGGECGDGRSSPLSVRPPQGAPRCSDPPSTTPGQCAALAPGDTAPGIGESPRGVPRRGDRRGVEARIRVTPEPPDAASCLGALPAPARSTLAAGRPCSPPPPPPPPRRGEGSRPGLASPAAVGERSNGSKALAAVPPPKTPGPTAQPLSADVPASGEQGQSRPGPGAARTAGQQAARTSSSRRRITLICRRVARARSDSGSFWTRKARPPSTPTTPSHKQSVSLVHTHTHVHTHTQTRGCTHTHMHTYTSRCTHSYPAPACVGLKEECSSWSGRRVAPPSRHMAALEAMGRSERDCEGPYADCDHLCSFSSSLASSCVGRPRVHGPLRVRAKDSWAHREAHRRRPACKPQPKCELLS